MKRFKKLLKDLFKISISLCIISLLYFSYQIQVNKTSQERSFNVPKGLSANQIGELLQEQAVINSSNAFKIYLKISNHNNIQAGSFIIPVNSNIPTIAKVLSSTPQNQKFTIQEGLTIAEIDAKLSAQSLIQPGEFQNTAQTFAEWDKYPFLTKNNNPQPLEGYIYPDTYFIDPANFTSQQLIDKSLANFKNKTSELNLTNEDIILASIIEQEVRSTRDRQMVTDLYQRRMDAGWRLDADITVVYLTNNRNITKSDLQIDSPYNTRKNKGLPPGPVSNPSIDSIKAVLNPIANDYWFYLTTLDTGEVIYAKTNEDHAINKQKYL